MVDTPIYAGNVVSPRGGGRHVGTGFVGPAGWPRHTSASNVNRRITLKCRHLTMPREPYQAVSRMATSPSLGSCDPRRGGRQD